MRGLQSAPNQLLAVRPRQTRKAQEIRAPFLLNRISGTNRYHQRRSTRRYLQHCPTARLLWCRGIFHRPFLKLGRDRAHSHQNRSAVTKAHLLLLLPIKPWASTRTRPTILSLQKKRSISIVCTFETCERFAWHCEQPKGTFSCSKARKKGKRGRICLCLPTKLPSLTCPVRPLWCISREHRVCKRCYAKHQLRTDILDNTNLIASESPFGWRFLTHGTH